MTTILPSKLVRLATTATFAALLVADRIAVTLLRLGIDREGMVTVAERQVRLLRAVGLDLIEMAEVLDTDEFYSCESVYTTDEGINFHCSLTHGHRTNHECCGTQWPKEAIP